VAEAGGAQVSDLLTALQRSVEEARTGRKPPNNPTGPGQRKVATKPGARKPSTRKPAAKKTPDESDTPNKRAGGRSQRGT
jgi:hypothetical protein